MKFSGKMWPIIILKLTKNQGFTLSLEDTFLPPPPPCHPIAVLELIFLPHCNKISGPYLLPVLDY